MITMPADVTAGGGWDGQSPHPHKPGELVPNKETQMDWAEHQRVVCGARTLLTSWTSDKNTGDAKKAFQTLYDAYYTTDKHIVLKVSKGIHQPETNPHLQIHVEKSFGDGNSAHYTFHLDVAAVDVINVAGAEERFMWEGVQFKYENAKVWANWPVLAAARQMKMRNGPARRLSISSVDLLKHKAALEEAKKREALADQKATTKALIEAALIKLEADSGFKLRTLKNEPPQKFWAGSTKAYVIDKYGRNGYYVQWDAVKGQLDRTI